MNNNRIEEEKKELEDQDTLHDLELAILTKKQWDEEIIKESLRRAKEIERRELEKSRKEIEKLDRIMERRNNPVENIIEHRTVIEEPSLIKKQRVNEAIRPIVDEPVPERPSTEHLNIAVPIQKPSRWERIERDYKNHYLNYLALEYARHLDEEAYLEDPNHTLSRLHSFEPEYTDFDRWLDHVVKAEKVYRKNEEEEFKRNAPFGSSFQSQKESLYLDNLYSHQRQKEIEDWRKAHPGVDEKMLKEVIKLDIKYKSISQKTKENREKEIARKALEEKKNNDPLREQKEKEFREHQLQNRIQEEERAARLRGTSNRDLPFLVEEEDGDWTNIEPGSEAAQNQRGNRGSREASGVPQIPRIPRIPNQVPNQVPNQAQDSVFGLNQRHPGMEPSGYVKKKKGLSFIQEYEQQRQQNQSQDYSQRVPVDQLIHTHSREGVELQPHLSSWFSPPNIPVVPLRTLEDIIEGRRPPSPANALVEEATPPRVTTPPRANNNNNREPGSPINVLIEEENSSRANRGREPAVSEIVSSRDRNRPTQSPIRIEESDDDDWGFADAVPISLQIELMQALMDDPRNYIRDLADRVFQKGDKKAKSALLWLYQKGDLPNNLKNMMMEETKEARKRFLTTQRREEIKGDEEVKELTSEEIVEMKKREYHKLKQEDLDKEDDIINKLTADALKELDNQFSISLRELAEANRIAPMGKENYNAAIKKIKADYEAEKFALILNNATKAIERLDKRKADRQKYVEGTLVIPPRRVPSPIRNVSPVIAPVIVPPVIAPPVVAPQQVVRPTPPELTMLINDVVNAPSEMKRQFAGLRLVQMMRTDKNNKKGYESAIKRVLGDNGIYFQDGGTLGIMFAFPDGKRFTVGKLDP